MPSGAIASIAGWPASIYSSLTGINGFREVRYVDVGRSGTQWCGDENWRCGPPEQILQEQFLVTFIPCISSYNHQVRRPFLHLLARLTLANLSSHGYRSA